MQSAGNLDLYSPNKPGRKPRVKTGFKDAKTARRTLKNISTYSKNYQTQVVITMYNRAKYHPHRTKEMESGMQIFKTWMDKNGIMRNVNKKTRKSKKSIKKIHV